jgi:hypothetical protein
MARRRDCNSEDFLLSGRFLPAWVSSVPEFLLRRFDRETHLFNALSSCPNFGHCPVVVVRDPAALGAS